MCRTTTLARPAQGLQAASNLTGAKKTRLSALKLKDGLAMAIQKY
jgi:hypothetical protein